MKYGIEIKIHEQLKIHWVECKAQAENMFKYYDNARLIIGDENQFLAYNFKRNGRVLTEIEYAQQEGNTDGRFLVSVHDSDSGRELYVARFENRSLAADMLDAVTQALNNASVEHEGYCIDEDLQLETYA